MHFLMSLVISQVRPLYKAERKQRGRHVQRPAGARAAAVSGHERDSAHTPRRLSRTSAGAAVRRALPLSAAEAEQQSRHWVTLYNSCYIADLY